MSIAFTLPFSAVKMRFNRWQLAVHLGSIVPFVVLIWDATHHHLTANPIQEATNRTGLTALVLLVLSLVCTPANALLGFKQGIKLRRSLGVYGFLYATVHVFIFFVVDYMLDLNMIKQAVLDQLYVLLGLAAFLLLLPLAVTSTKGWMKRLGKRWKKLHWMVYLAVPLVVAHYWWQVKADIRVPLEYGVVIALLLFVRLPPVRRMMSNLRFRLTPKPVAAVQSD
jgi:methionine sulfoxide reductase heme-binding subunit